ncbi:putative F-box/LRR-repeat protein At4g15060 [Phragmites australis]|uniref:putative F-box/LRR-repeat protein At4g15060 n=1 Tax=Phragmites australis TaxID=29695 RepID=UPI002D77CC99|nr:putative F-box/LRR-repeat protein At4g15060 [Phragmites australis]
MSNNLVSKITRMYHGRGEAIDENGRPNVRFEDLPTDVLYRIVSKLPPKEFSRTRVLSSQWRCMWSACPRLTFDGVAVCNGNMAGLHQRAGKFIHEVNAVLQKHHGKVVETLDVRIDLFDSLLVQHLNNWVAFAVSSRTKNLTLDLRPRWFYWVDNDRYVFPFELLDSGSISRLQHMQLSFVSLKPPAQFRGFPNLRKLHIQLFNVSRKDLERMLSHCCNLEWLWIDRCDLNDELIVDGSLSHLLYLRVEHCKLTKIKFHAVNLATFEYQGDSIPIDLSHSSKLQNAYIKLNDGAFQHALTSLLNWIPNVQNLTLNIWWLYLEKQWMWDNPLKFSYLRHLQLFMFIGDKEVDKVLYSVSFLRATPSIENLEVHFTGYSLWLADVGPRRQDLGRCKYNYLKNMRVTGFKAARGQLEFLLHVVENAPALEVLTVNTTQEASKEFWPYEGSGPPFEEAKRIARTSLTTALRQNVNFYVI